MKRRDFIALLGGAAVPWPLNVSLAAAASDAEIPHVGILDPQSKGGIQDRQYWSAFREGMHALGYDDGKTVIFDDRWADYDYRGLPALASELIKLRVRIIVSVDARHHRSKISYLPSSYRVAPDGRSGRIRICPK